MLRDAYGRPLTHARITVTSKCNYACFFCHGEGEGASRDLLTPHGIGLFAEAAVSLGIRYFKLTGGEPLLRRDLDEAIASIKRWRGVEVSIVTNGYYLADRLGGLVEAGLDRLNVSLASLRPDSYRAITGVDGLSRVLQGLRLCRDYGVPVKLNVVVLRGLNEGEVPSIIEYASGMGFDVSLIELIPLGVSREAYARHHLKLNRYAGELERMGASRVLRSFQNRPVYVLPSGTRVELVMGYGSPDFCMGCTRIRLTHDAKLKPCLYRNDNLVDVAPLLGGSLPHDEAVRRLREAIMEANRRRRPYFTAYSST